MSEVLFCPPKSKDTNLIECFIVFMEGDPRGPNDLVTNCVLCVRAVFDGKKDILQIIGEPNVILYNFILYKVNLLLS